MNRSLLTMRAALVLLLGVLVGAGADALTALSGRGPAESVMAGAAACAGAVAFFDWVIDEG
ncbi:hypothetical protein [Streptomyces caeruleatus]|uniref:Uncharacterized protein n=1 Tax=Streptomyces caeruleatus TaxID=661399 RepID=A0A117RPZ4_9ACTN|nr:hypothetical protein [Streptomyces caeruleatus]KUO02886.1 hypothetical protein AQJ67_20975 [Streptomyces caeruleatus]